MVITADTDADIQRSVLRELEWDPRVDVTDVGVQVHGGIVVLTGRVRNYARKIAAQEAAHRVAGVHDVVNSVEVESPNPDQLDDAEIARAVRHALVWDVHVPGENIHSTVTNGWVALTGTVERLAERDEATRAVQTLRGVVGVSNDISVREQTVDADWIRRSVEEALDRLAHVEAEHLDIRVSDGIIRISGKVRSIPERTAVLETAGRAPGVRAIEEHLVVDEAA